MSEGLVLLYSTSLFYPLHSDQPAPSTEAVPAATVQHIPALVQKYIDYLKDRYKAHRISPMLKEGVKIRPKQFIHLNMVSNEEEEEDDEMKSNCLLLQLYGDVAAIKKKRRPMEMEDIGRREDQSVAQHILVEGSPGIGKTMFSWELCRQWAEGKMLQDRDIVLMLQLRSKRVREANSLSELFYHDNDSIKQEVLEHITSVDGRGVFLVLEGYDELTETQRTESSILTRLLTGDCLSKASIMVTSRPLANDSLCPEFIDQHIEVVGFNDEDIKSYVEMACQKQPRILPDLMSYIASNPFVSSIMYIPLQCATLTALYIEKWRENKGKAYAPTTLTQLYTDLLLSSLIRYISDHQEYSKCKTKIRQLSDLPSEVQEQVWQLSQLAAEGLENRQFIFDSIPCDHMGLMQSAEEELVIGSSVSYCFLHLTLQEYLAALHWSRMGSEDMVRLVSETSLFPLATLVRDGITAGHHWPALYFLSGLTKLTSVPLELLKESLQAADATININIDDDLKRIFQFLDIFCVSVVILSNRRKCNPYFFEMLFETQSRDLTTKLFTHKNSVLPSSTNPIECFVTAWCVANSDPTSQWKLAFNDDLLLERFAEHFVRFTNVSDSTKSSYGSVTGILLEDHGSIKQPHATAELVKSFSSLFPYLEGIAFPAYIANSENVPLLCSAVKLSSLKALVIGYSDQEGDELPAAVCIPPLHCPSLTTICLGRACASLIESLVLPNINTLTTIYMSDGCRPMSGLEFGNFCSCLCQSTSLECFAMNNVDLSAHELKELVSALEQISSLKMVVFNDGVPPILTHVGIRQVKQAIKSSTLIKAINDGAIDEEDIEEYLRNTLRPLPSLLSDQDSSQSLDPLTADIQSSSHQSARDLEVDELQLSLSLLASILTAQDKQVRRYEEQKYSIQEALPEDGKEENDHDLEDEELQQPKALSLEENIEQRRRDKEQQHSIQECLSEDGEEENDQDLEDDELQLALALSASIQTAQDDQRRRGEEQQHSIQEALPEDGQEDDLEDEELQQPKALSLQLVLSLLASIQTAQDKKRRRGEEQKYSIQEALPEDGKEENDHDLEDEELQQPKALSLEENIEQRRRDKEQQHSIQECLSEDGEEENDQDLEDDELQLALALSASIQTAQDEQRRRGEEQQHSIQEALPEDGQEDDLEDEELQQPKALLLEENIEQRRSEEEQQHSIQEALPEDGEEENGHDLENEELQQAKALSLEENIEQRRRDEEQQHSIQESLSEDGEEENYHDLEDEELQQAIALSLEENIEQEHY